MERLNIGVSYLYSLGPIGSIHVRNGPSLFVSLGNEKKILVVFYFRIELVCCVGLVVMF